MSPAKALRAQAIAIRAEAEARALALEVVADSIERDGDRASGPEWLPIKKAAKRFEISASSIRKATADEQIATRFVGREIVVRVEDVSRWIERQSATAPRKPPATPKKIEPEIAAAENEQDPFERARLLARHRQRKAG